MAAQEPTTQTNHVLETEEPDQLKTTKQPTTTTQPTVKKPKQQYTAAEIRQRRKRQAVKRRERILKTTAARDDYVRNRLNHDTFLKEEEQQSLSNALDQMDIIKSDDNSNSQSTNQINNNRNANPFGNPSDPMNIFNAMNANMNNGNMNANLEEQMESMLQGMGMGGMGAMGGMGGMGAMGGIQGMQGIGNMFESLLGNNGNTMSSEEILEKWKKDEEIEKYDRYSHHLFCLLFALLLVFIPSDYDLSLFGYYLQSDTWTFFLSFEIVLLCSVYGYKQWFKRQYQKKGNYPTNNGNSLMSILDNPMFSALMGGNAITKWIERGKTVFNSLKMFWNFLSDLCFVVFLWIILTAVKTTVNNVF